MIVLLVAASVCVLYPFRRNFESHVLENIVGFFWLPSLVEAEPDTWVDCLIEIGRLGIICQSWFPFAVPFAFLGGLYSMCSDEKFITLVWECFFFPFMDVEELKSPILLSWSLSHGRMGYNNQTEIPFLEIPRGNSGGGVTLS